MKRDYHWVSSGSHMDHMKEFLEETLGERGRLLRFETTNTSDPGWFAHEFSIDWFGVNEWLDGKVRRILAGLRGTEDWKVSRVNFFVDFAFAPIVSSEVEALAAQHPKLAYVWCTKALYEHCEIHGPTRYGAIGEYWDTYRFYAGPIDMDSDELRIFDVEDSLEVCVGRITEYILTGHGRNDVNLTRRYFRTPKA